jgi:hypothetical protein
MTVCGFYERPGANSFTIFSGNGKLNGRRNICPADYVVERFLDGFQRIKLKWNAFYHICGQHKIASLLKPQLAEVANVLELNLEGDDRRDVFTTVPLGSNLSTSSI